jgi:hypothetical protein
MASNGAGLKKQAMGVISFVIGLILIAYLVPVAIDSLVNATTTGWPTAVTALWGLMPIFAIIGALLMCIAGALAAFDVI